MNRSLQFRLGFVAGFVLFQCAAPVKAQESAARSRAVSSLLSLGVQIKVDDKVVGKPAIEARIALGISDDRCEKDFAPIRLLSTLRRIEVTGFSVSDDFVEHLIALENLEALDLVLTSVTDKGVARLSTLKKLRELRICHCSNVTDKGITTLGKLANLELLWIKENPKVTGTGLTGLRELTKLRSLDLDWSRITDEGVKALGGHPSLESLALNGCPITDQSLSYLPKIPKLRDVAFASTGVTDAGVRAFRERHPSIGVYDGGTPDE
jgi:hypothetical protein